MQYFFMWRQGADRSTAKRYDGISLALCVARSAGGAWVIEGRPSGVRWTVGGIEC